MLLWGFLLFKFVLLWMLFRFVLIRLLLEPVRFRRGGASPLLLWLLLDVLLRIHHHCSNYLATHSSVSQLHDESSGDTESLSFSPLTRP